MLDLTITSEQKVHVKLTPVTATGKPAVVDGVPVWSVVSGNSTVQPDEDGLGAFLVSTDEVDGVPTVFMVDADPDLGPEIGNIQDTITLNVTNAQAQNLGVIADAPVDK